MPRLLHLADVHLGARHLDLGPAASRQRERQAAALRRAIDAGLEAQVDVALVCGDLFDSNAQPRRVVEAAATELRRLTERNVRVVIIPGIHDSWEAGSIYRVFDLRLMAGLSEGSDLLTVLTPQRPDVVFKDLDLVVYGRVAAVRRVARSPLADFTVHGDTRAGWRVAMIHGSLASPGTAERDDVEFTAEEVAASGLDYLALGHAHDWQTGTSGGTTWASPGAVEPLGPGQEDRGRVAIVQLTERKGRRSVDVRDAVVGRTRYSTLELDAGEIGSHASLAPLLQRVADPDLVLDVRVTGSADHWIDIDPASLDRELGDAFLRVRVTDATTTAEPGGDEPRVGTIAHAYRLALMDRLSAADAAGDHASAADARAALLLGRQLLDDPRQVGLI
jgi:DNA repair exonuclease SbcCD nuclease subunit